MNSGAEPARWPISVVLSDIERLREKICSLEIDRFSNEEMASFLDVCSKHFAVVLKKTEAAARRLRPDGDPTGRDGDDDAAVPVERARASVGACGKIAIPEEFLRSLGIEAGGAVIIAREKDHLTIVSQAAEVDRVARMIARYLPARAAPIDDLIAKYSRRKSDKREDS